MIEIRVMRGDAILDPRSSILDPRSSILVGFICILPVL